MYQALVITKVYTEAFPVNHTVSFRYNQARLRALISVTDAWCNIMCFVWLPPFIFGMGSRWEWERLSKKIEKMVMSKLRWCFFAPLKPLGARCVLKRFVRGKNKEHLCLWLEEWKCVHVCLRVGMFSHLLWLWLSPYLTMSPLYVCVCVLLLLIKMQGDWQLSW